jgi:ribonuclease P protein component
MPAGHTSAALRPLRKRAQFLNASKGVRAGRIGFSLQAIAVADLLPGLGFTVTNKTGNSPERNRIRRRLRAAAKACGAGFQPQHDYVLVGRREALTLPFARVVSDLGSALLKVHSTRPPQDPARP